MGHPPATYSGVFTLLPLLTGLGRAHHGWILQKSTEMAEQMELKPLLADQQYGANDLAGAYETVAKGSRGKVVIEL